MATVLIALQDPTLRDQVRAALRLFPSVRAPHVPRNRVREILTEPGVAEALILDHQPDRDGSDPFIAEIRALDREVAILAVTDQADRHHFNRSKMELDIFSFIPLPLDPFDLLHRLHRLTVDIAVRG
jgi:hypothetical protein